MPRQASPIVKIIYLLILSAETPTDRSTKSGLTTSARNTIFAWTEKFSSLSVPWDCYSTSTGRFAISKLTWRTVTSLLVRNKKTSSKTVANSTRFSQFSSKISLSFGNVNQIATCRQIWPMKRKRKCDKNFTFVVWHFHCHALKRKLLTTLKAKGELNAFVRLAYLILIKKIWNKLFILILENKLFVWLFNF